MSLFTLGHSLHPASTIVSLLQEQGVTILCDVRSKPYSRHNPEVNQKIIAAVLSKAGIRYIFGGNVLGGFSPLPVTDTLFIEKMQKVVALGEADNLAMMCSERNPGECHRAFKLCAWLHRNTDLHPQHIMPGGVLLDSRAFEATITAKRMAYNYPQVASA